MGKALNNLLIKPAGPDCPMACTYCFYLEKHKLFTGTNRRMSLDVLEETIRQFMEQSTGAVALSWQGGEPTLMGIDFFQKAVHFMETYGQGQTVGNGLQTGGFLIDKNWGAFLKQYRFLVGLSLDGTQHVHDRYRKDRAGRGTWSRVMETLDILRSRDVAVNAVATLNDYSVQHIEETYNFFKQEGLVHMQFIPLVEQGPEGITGFSLTAEDFGTGLMALFDLWRNDFRDGHPSTFIRFFDALFHHYVNLEPPQCSLTEECGSYLLVEHDGSVYPCDFYVEEERILGNVMTDRLDEMLNSPEQTRFGREKGYLPHNCRTCQWRSLCQGGCPKERLLAADRGRHTNALCHGYRSFFHYADPWFKQLAQSFAR